MNSSKLWAHDPAALDGLSDLLGHVTRSGSLTYRQRAILVTSCASALGDSYCSLAWGKRLADDAGAEVAERVLRGDDAPLDSAETGAGPLGPPARPRSELDDSRRRAIAARRRLRRRSDLRRVRVRGATHRLLHRQRRARHPTRSATGCRCARGRPRRRHVRPADRDVRARSDHRRTARRLQGPSRGPWSCSPPRRQCSGALRSEGGPVDVESGDGGDAERRLGLADLVDRERALHAHARPRCLPGHYRWRGSPCRGRVSTIRQGEAGTRPRRSRPEQAVVSSTKGNRGRGLQHPVELGRAVLPEDGHRVRALAKLRVAALPLRGEHLAGICRRAGLQERQTRHAQLFLQPGRASSGALT